MRCRIALGLAVWLILAMTARATDFVVPQQKIVGAETVIPLGDMVILSVSPIESPPPHLLATSYRWKMLDRNGKEKRVIEHDGGIFCGTGIEPTNMLAICAITHLYVVKDGDKTTEIATRTVFLLTHVKIGEGPMPPPPPPPDKVFPDGTFKLSKTTYDLVTKHVQPGVNQQKGSQALATSFRGVAAAIAAGTLKDPAIILKQTTAANQNALKEAGVPLSEWEPCFRVMQDVIYELYSSGALRTSSDYRVAWGEIALGLEGVAK